MMLARSRFWIIGLGLMALVFGLGFLLQKPKVESPVSRQSAPPQRKEELRAIVTLYHTQKPNLLKALHYEEQLLAVETSRPEEFERYREIARKAKAEVRALRFLEGLKAASDEIAYMIPKTQGLILDDRNQYASAIAKYREALSFANAPKGPLRELLGTDLMRIHNYQEAQSVLEESLENFHEANRANAQEPMQILSTETLDLKLIDVYLNNGDYQKALAKTLTLLKTDSQNPELQKFKEMAEMGIKGGK